MAGHDGPLSHYVWESGHEMGKLEFSGLRIQVLSQDSAFVRGSWKLTMSHGKPPHGLFTLCSANFPRDGRLCTTILRRRSERSRDFRLLLRPHLHSCAFG